MSATFTLDGKEVPFRDGQTIIQAAQARLPISQFFAFNAFDCHRQAVKCRVVGFRSCHASGASVGLLVLVSLENALLAETLIHRQYTGIYFITRRP